MQLDWLASKPQNPLTPSAGITGKMGIGDSVQVPMLVRQILSLTEVIFPGPKLSL